MASRAPTVRQRRLAAALRRLREQRNLTAEEIAARLDWSQSKISRIETAKIGVRPSDVRLLLELYGVNETHRGEILSLAQAAQEKRWWHDHQADISESFAGFIAFEDEADSLLCFEQQVVPGLLQTQEYARHVIKGWNVIATVSPQQIDRLLDVRMRRQEVLTRPEPLRFSALLDESVLMRCVGGPEVMYAQLDNLVRVAQLPNIDLRVIPLSATRDFCLSESFILLTFSSAYDVSFPDIVHSETVTSVHSQDESLSHVYRLIWENGVAHALDPARSVEHISRIAQDLWRRGKITIHIS